MDDVFSRGRYATDASIYQVEPLAVVIPRTVEDAVRRTCARTPFGRPRRTSRGIL